MFVFECLRAPENCDLLGNSNRTHNGESCGTAKKTPMKMSVVQLYVRLGGWELLVVLSVNSKLQ